MIRRPRAHELIVGLAEDATFGPVVLFGQGGVAVEVLADRAVGLPPLDGLLAREMIARTRVSRLLAGYRDRPAADVDAVAGALVRLAELAAHLPEVAELDVNPLLADEEGVMALDARIVVRPPDPDPERRFAIRPYPQGLEARADTRDGLAVTIRPVRPEDEPALADLFAGLGDEDRRLRFLGSLSEAPRGLAARLSQIDYDREMTLVAFDGSGAALGCARLVSDPEFETAEFSIAVRTQQKGRGIGHALMSRLVAYARSRGLVRLLGQVSLANTAMLALAHELGAEVRGVADSPELREVQFDLARA